MEPDRGRSQRVAAGVVGIALFLGAVWLVTTGWPYGSTPRGSPSPTSTEPPASTRTPLTSPPRDIVSARVGFVGLPPEGATPSRPRTGALILDYQGRRFATWYQVWVYADGRLIWQREGNLPEGANQASTGLLEQRLTRDGVRMLRARGTAEQALFGFPWRPPYPASWLPPRAWDDRTIRAYVPSRYAVCYGALLRAIEPSRVARWLPQPAEELLVAGEAPVRSLGGWLESFGGACAELSTDRARAVAEALEGAGLWQDVFQRWYGLTYYVEARGVRNEAFVRFEPILPHGEAACSGCG